MAWNDMNHFLPISFLPVIVQFKIKKSLPLETAFELRRQAQELFCLSELDVPQQA